MFVYDDGPALDYTRTFPVHRQEGAPGCVAVITGSLGHAGWLTYDHLREMQAAGWEVMSHTVEHRALSHVPVTRDVSPGDTRIYVESNVHARTPGPIRIANDDRYAFATIADGGEDEAGSYLELKESVGTAFSAEGTFERFTDEVLRAGLAKSKTALQRAGFRASSLVVPYGRYDDHVQELVADYYQAVPNANYGGLNYPGSIDPYQLNRRYFDTETLTKREVGLFLDTVAEEDALGIFGGHSQNEALTPERIRRAIRLARERNVRIVTLHEALAELAVIETPTPSPTATLTPTTDEADHLVGVPPAATPSPTVTPTPTASRGPLATILAFFDTVIKNFLNYL